MTTLPRPARTAATRSGHRPTRSLLVAATVLATAGSGLIGAFTAGPATAAPLVSAAGPAAGDVIPGEYLVVLKDGASARTVSAAAARGATAGGSVRHRFSKAFAGYSATLSAAELATVRQDPAVAYVQANRRYRSTGTDQKNAVWGLDRVDQRGTKLSGSYYYSNTGAGVDVYIVDTGLMTDHPDFDGRVGEGINTQNSGSIADCDGHGTHVTGSAAGTYFGVAKKVLIHPVRVLNCNGEGSTDSVAAGLEWVAQQHGTNPAVANLSLGSDTPGADPAMDAAVRALIDDGVSVVLAAGNDGDPACDYSPNNVAGAIVVGATTRTDDRAAYSNYGSCVDVYAPGDKITSDWIGHTGDGSYQQAIDSGTSMAAPHVTGAVALYLQRHPTATPAQVKTAIQDAATQKAVGNVSAGSHGRLLFAPQKVTPPPATTDPTRILNGTALRSGKKICSPSAVYCLTQRSSDGRLVLYRASDKKTIWTNKVDGAAWTTLTGTGNLVSYNAYGKRKWSTGTSGINDSQLRVRDRGYLALVDLPAGNVVWNTTPFES